MHAFTLLTLVGAAFAAPTTQLAKRQTEGPSTNATTGAYVTDVPIHSSCNATEREALQAALADVTNITQTAINYVARYGAESPMFQRYFGNGDYTTVLGSLNALIQSNKDGMLLRCDDIDGNCVQDGWNGHWRGSNATAETVICPLSYQTRKPLSEMCNDGYTVSNSSASYYFATDLIHRLYHVPQISDAEVEHYADSYQECLELAANNATWAPYNTHTIQYFVADVYALEVARPGVGCTGELPEVLTAPAPASSGSPTATSSAAQSCHTHADGEIHCV